METGKLYFIKDEFYNNFKNCGLMENKDIVNGKEHDRPCCYMFKFTKDDSDLFWMIPISSKVSKYETIYNRTMQRYGCCDNISFGYILGEKHAFLIQNLFPVTKEYIKNVYIDTNTLLPITISNDLMSELNAKARKKIRYNQQGKILGISDIMTIYNTLISEKNSEDATN